MVKQTVLSKRQKKSPRKLRKGRNQGKRNNRSRRRSSVSINLESAVRRVADSSLVLATSNFEASGLNDMNSCGKTNSSMKADEDYVILIDDSIIDIAQECNNDDADSSCFIIDVEPNLNPEEEKSFYKYSLCEKNSDSNIEKTSPGCDENNKNSANDVKVSCGNIKEIPDSSSSCSNDANTNLERCGTSSTKIECSEDSTSRSSESAPKPGTKIGNQQVEMFNDIVNKMKNDGFFSSGKRSFKGSCPNSKRFAYDVGDAEPGTWNSFKKSLGTSSPKKNPSKSVENAQNLASKNLLNKHNSQGKNNVSCVNLEDSDSDVEFIDSFNPSEKLIELSDDEGSVIIEDVIEAPPPLPVIKLPGGKKTKKSQGAALNKCTVAKLYKKMTKRMKQKEKLKKAKKLKIENRTLRPIVIEKIENRTLRPIVIDGCNVGYGHLRTGMLSVEGIKICYDYFKNKGHDVKIFLPQFKLYSCRTSNNALLKQMEKEGSVILTPGRKVDGMAISSYDDRFILEYATLKGAIVVTRDNYRDLYAEKEEFRETIRDRLLQYTFVDDLIMFPDDPLGRDGPRLNEFLRFPTEQTNDSQKQNTPSTSKS